MKYYRGAKERIGFDFYADIAVRIVSARQRKGMTQKQLEKVLKWNGGKLQRLESVKIRISMEDLEELSTALDVTVNWLLEAYNDSPLGDCLYLVSTDAVPDLEAYVKAPNARLALLMYESKLKKYGIRLWNSARDRGSVRLVGVPVDKAEMRDRYGKYQGEESLEEDQDEQK